MTKEPEGAVHWRPQPGPQTAFIHCPIPEIFFVLYIKLAARAGEERQMLP